MAAKSCASAKMRRSIVRGQRDRPGRTITRARRAGAPTRRATSYGSVPAVRYANTGARRFSIQDGRANISASCRFLSVAVTSLAFIVVQSSSRRARAWPKCYGLFIVRPMLLLARLPSTRSVGHKVSGNCAELAPQLGALNSFFSLFPEGVRRIIYTTNAIEALNSKLRRAARTREHFPRRRRHEAAISGLGPRSCGMETTTARVDRGEDAIRRHVQRAIRELMTDNRPHTEILIVPVCGSLTT